MKQKVWLTTIFVYKQFRNRNLYTIKQKQDTSFFKGQLIQSGYKNAVCKIWGTDSMYD